MKGLMLMVFLYSLTINPSEELVAENVFEEDGADTIQIFFIYMAIYKREGRRGSKTRREAFTRRSLTTTGKGRTKTRRESFTRRYLTLKSDGG
mmetsp:Transcript_11924/g.15459  ORF Transcript_11924/g.15459 Transcript_11924/m.15459 type:complete len:93 (-) Transcript_11924:389-667(-)